MTAYASRQKEIERLKRLLAHYTAEHKRKDALITYAQLRSLQMRQLKAENRKAKAA